MLSMWRAETSAVMTENALTFHMDSKLPCSSERDHNGYLNPEKPTKSMSGTSIVPTIDTLAE
jgi:hypothetical protein